MSEPIQPPSFEEALAQLEQIVRDLEAGTLGLEEALGRYEQGVKLLRQCHGLLDRAERRIELLAGVDADGNPLTEPYADPAIPEKQPAGEGVEPKSHHSPAGGKHSRSEPAVRPPSKKRKPLRESDIDQDDIDEPQSLF